MTERTYERICFMVMPFGVKKTLTPNAAAPSQINFDRIWNELWKPLIRSLKYEPVRADADLAASIVREMIERLALSDLVIADVTLHNPNVFYEVGVRHAAAEKGCVLVAADWSKAPFDLQTIRHIKYKLKDETMSDDEVKENLTSMQQRVRELAESKTPCYELEGFPKLPKDRTLAFREALKRMDDWNARVTNLHQRPRSPERTAGVAQLIEEFKSSGEESLTVAFELLKLVRDTGDWKLTLEFIDLLPKSVADSSLFVEQRALATAKHSDPFEAIGPLKALIERDGSTPEREGLLGGRYKQLYRKSRESSPLDAENYLNEAIEHYERGRELDLNEYYCAANLPLLLKSRGESGDLERATRIATCVVAACERAINRRMHDEYVYPTLLGAAFNACDVPKAKELAKRVQRDPANWKLDSTIADLIDIVNLTPDPCRKELAAILEKLKLVAAPRG